MNETLSSRSALFEFRSAAQFPQRFDRNGRSQLTDAALVPSQAPAADGGRGPAGEGVGPAAALSPRHLGQALPDQRDLLAAQRHGLHDGPGERLRGVSVAPPR